MELNENGIKRLPSVEMPWLKYFKDCDIREEVPKKTIYTLAYEMNEDTLKKTAIDVRTSKNDFKYGFKVSYDDLFRRSRIVGKSLSELGVKQDEIRLLHRGRAGHSERLQQTGDRFAVANVHLAAVCLYMIAVQTCCDILAFTHTYKTPFFLINNYRPFYPKRQTKNLKNMLTFFRSCCILLKSRKASAAYFGV